MAQRVPKIITCPICSKNFRIRPYALKKAKGLLCCSVQCRKEHWKILKDTESGAPSKKHKTYFDKFLAIRLAILKTRAKEKQLPFDLTLDYLKDLYFRQKGLCYYTKIPMKLGSDNWKTYGQADLEVLSVDKIHPDKGYVEGNIVYCCSAINKLKGSASLTEFANFVSKITVFHLDREMVNAKESGQIGS